MPRVHAIENTTANTPTTIIDSETQLPIQHDDHEDLLDIATPSSILNDRPGKRTGLQGGKRMKWKNKSKVKQPSGGICHILALPEDVLRVLLGRMPPRSLNLLAQTCAGLREIMEDESIWRDCYVNRFMGSVRIDEVKQDMKVLVQGCLGSVRGWKKEALGREAMLERWMTSKAAPNTHHPSVGLIHSISLSYPVSNPTPRGVVGKTHNIVGHVDSATDIDHGESSSPAKMTARQKYDARIAATTRPPPAVYSAGLGPGAIVKSDPISGKVSKGFWGAGRDANFHIHPQMNLSDPPTTIFFSDREQNYALWGRLDGSIVHTALEMKHPSAAGSRAQSVSTSSAASDRHSGEVLAVCSSKGDNGVVRFASGGSDGLVKYWEFNPAPPKSARKAGGAGNEASISCLFTSDNVEPMDHRSDDIKRRRNGAPDPILLVKCDVGTGVICAVTEDGDLRVWWGIADSRQEARVDVGSTDDQGPVKTLEMEVIDGDEMRISVLVMHYRATSFERYDISINKSDGHYDIDQRSYVTPLKTPLTAIKPLLKPAPPIAIKHRQARPSLLAPIADDESDAASDQSSPVLSPQPDSKPVARGSEFGKFIVAGDADGSAWIWAWDMDGTDVAPIRGWSATDRKITAVEYHCGLVAIGSCDTYIKIYDPLPALPELLKSFRVHHLSPADIAVAESDDFMAGFYTVNQIILENDLVIASVGRKVFAWKAGIGKKGYAKGDAKRGRVLAHRSLRTLDMRSLHEDVVDVKREAKAREEEESQSESRSERQQWAMMDEMGLDADAALQYAMMLSMEEQGDHAKPVDERQSISKSKAAKEASYDDDTDDYDQESRMEEPWSEERRFGDDQVDEAVRAVEEYRRKEEEEMRDALEQIRLAEERERRGK